MIAVHSIERYIDNSNCVWETAITYTGRLVIHSGMIQEDGITFKLSEWKTLHEVKIPLFGLAKSCGHGVGYPDWYYFFAYFALAHQNSH